MTRMIALLALVALTLGAEPAPWCPWMGATNQVFLYADLQGLRQTPLLQEVLNGQDQVSRFTEQMRQWTAVDLDTVTDLWLGIAGKDDVVFVLQGQYNLGTIRGLVSGIERFKIGTPTNAEFTVTMPDDKRPGKANLAAFVDPRTLVFGRPEQVNTLLANRASKTLHPRAAELAVLAEPTHLLEAVVLRIPDPQGKTPRILVDTIRRLHLAADAAETLEVELNLYPTDPRLVTPLGQFVESGLEVFRLLPAEHRRLGRIPDALATHAEVAVSTEAVVLSTRLPVDLVRRPLTQRLRVPGPAKPAPAAPPNQPQPAAP